VSINEIDTVLYLPGHTREALQPTLRIPALSPGWQESLRNPLDQADRDGVSGNSGLNPTAGAAPLAWSGFRPLRVTEVRTESDSVFSVILADPDASPLPG
jgi:hypothetical protein